MNGSWHIPLRGRRWLCTLLFLCFCLAVGYGQDAPVSSGGNATGNGGTVAYSLGQAIYTALESSSGTVNQGVQQAYEIYTVGEEAMPEHMTMTICPNPTRDNLTLRIDAGGDISLSYQLFDMQGRLLDENAVEGQTQINTSHISTGMYMLTVRLGMKPIRSFKIIKNK